MLVQEFVWVIIKDEELANKGRPFICDENKI
jgi:hypothetical protein